MYNNHKTQEKKPHLNISDLNFSSELTDEELSNISGGGFAAAGAAIGSLAADHANGERLNWRSAYAWAVGAGIGASPFGVKAAALGGED